METESLHGSAVDVAEKKAAVTEKQARYLSMYKTHGSLNAVARAAGVHLSTVKESLEATAEKLGFENYKDMAPRATAPKRNSSGSAKQKVCASKVAELVKLVELQGFRCALSGVEISVENVALDHKQALSRGGTDALSNLQWIEKDVNRAKGVMTNDEFIAMCKRVVAWNR